MKDTFGPFPRGINNRAPDFAPPGTGDEGGDYLRDAMNVDISNTGTLKRRVGYTRVGDPPTIPTPDPDPDPPSAIPHLGYTATDLLGDMQGVHVNRRVAVQGKKLCYSYPFAQGVTNTAFQYEEFPADITGWISTDDGLYVSSDALYFIAGPLPAKQTVQVHPSPGLRNSFGRLPNSKTVFWVTVEGIAMGSSQGEVKLLQWENYAAAIDPTATAITAFRDRDGMRQIIAIIDQEPTTAPGASDTIGEAAVVPATVRTTLVVNIETGATSRYENFGFDSLHTTAGVLYGVIEEGAAAGLYKIEGDTDAGVPIAASFSLGRTDFQAPQIKILSDAYVAGRSDKPLKARIRIEGEEGATSYTYVAECAGPQIQRQRFKLGRGLRAPYFGIEFFNQGGADFELSTVAFNVAKSARRIAR